MIGLERFVKIAADKGSVPAQWAQAEIERLRAELAHQERMRAELRDALTEAAQSLGIDPDGMDDLMVLRVIVARELEGRDE